MAQSHISHPPPVKFIPPLQPIVLVEKRNGNALIPNSQPQPSPHLIAHFPLILVSPFSPHLSGFHVRRTLVIGLRQHAHHRDQDLLDALNGRPSLRRMLVVVGIVAGGMEDGDTDCSIGVDCRQVRPSATYSNPLYSNCV